MFHFAFAYPFWRGIDKFILQVMERRGTSIWEKRVSMTEVFFFFEDMPAARFLLMNDEKALDNQPKQPSPERDLSANAWWEIRRAEEFVAVRELALSIDEEGLWRIGRTTRQHHMMHGDL